MWALGGRPSLSTKDPSGPWHHSQMTSTDATSAAGGSPPPTGHPAWSRSGHAFPQVKSAAGESQKQLTRRKPIFESEDAIKYNNCVGGGRDRGESLTDSQEYCVHHTEPAMRPDRSSTGCGLLRDHFCIFGWVYIFTDFASSVSTC